MTSRYSPTRRDAYLFAEGKRRTISSERATARSAKALARISNHTPHN